MFARRYISLGESPVWSRLLTFSVVLFFLFLGDAILSFWVPNFLEDSLGSPLLMGIVLGFSSVVGLGADIILPQLLIKSTVKRLLLLSIVTSLLFCIALIGSTVFPYILIFFVTMAIWGIYYEFIGFSNHQFVADAVPFKLHSASWAIIGTFKSIAYFIGPIIGGFLVVRSETSPLFMSATFILISLLVLITSKKIHNRAVDTDIRDVNIFKELEHWRVLIRYVWPVITLSLFLFLIDATFWSTGAVWTEELAKTHFLGGLFLPLYTLPSLFMGLYVAKLKIYKGKKKWAYKFSILAGVAYILLGINDGIIWQLLMVFVGSTFLSIVFPLVDAAYSDIIARMGRQRKHLIGLSASTVSISYIIGPILSGFIVDRVGARMNFVVLGIATVIVAIVLYITSPSKLRLPQQELEEWD